MTRIEPALAVLGYTMIFCGVWEVWSWGAALIVGGILSILAVVWPWNRERVKR